MANAGACGGTKVDREEEQYQLSLEGDVGLWFFFIDAFEDEDDNAGPPRVYLFGKVHATSAASYQSCCLVVENIERCVHLLLNAADPDDPEAASEAARDAEAEFDEICRTRWPGVRKLRARLKWRNYAFEKPLPHGPGHLPFLKVVCDSSGQMPPIGLRGKSFSQMFGLNTSLLERLLLTRRISGPSWIRLLPGSWKADAARLSSCDVELRITPASIFAPKKDAARRELADRGMPSTSPPLRVLSLSMQTFQSSAQEPHEPVVIACTLHPSITMEATSSDCDNDLRRGMETWAGVRGLDSKPLPRDSERTLPQKGIEHFNSEVALLSAFLSTIQRFDPDVLVGYSVYGFDLEVLAARLQLLKLQTWQKLSRLRRSREIPARVKSKEAAGSLTVGKRITAGRLVCDILLQSRELLPKLNSFELPNLVRKQLRIDPPQTVDLDHLPRFYNTVASLVELMDVTLQNSLCITRLMHSLQIVPLTRQLSNLVGNTWNSSLQNRRAERGEMLLCHEFHRRKFVMPDRDSAVTCKWGVSWEEAAAGLLGSLASEEEEPLSPRGRVKRTGSYEQEPLSPPSSPSGVRPQLSPLSGPRSPSGRRGKMLFGSGEEPVSPTPTARRLRSSNSSTWMSEPRLSCVLLEPKAGLYSKFVLLLDFNSLYPAIIQECNICFTTVERPDEMQVLQCPTEADVLAQTGLPDEEVGEGVLPQVIKRLVDSRKDVKDVLRDERNAQRLQTLEIRKKALTFIINSMFACLSYQSSRFYAKPLTAIITAKGREALQSSVAVVQDMHLDVLYGDTDSVIVNTKTTEYKQAIKSAQQIKRSINKKYRRLEIRLEAIFMRLMLVNKSKYAAVKVVDWDKRHFERDLVGLDVVRRDSCRLAKDIGEQVLIRVMEDRNADYVQRVHNFLAEKAKEMDERRVLLESYIITKTLNKDPRDYPDAKFQPHVQVALRLLSNGKAAKSGQGIPYIICEAAEGQGSKTSLAERARHPSEMTADLSLRVDLEWYKKQQIHPLVAQLLGPVGGINSAKIAESLGCDQAPGNNLNYSQGYSQSFTQSFTQSLALSGSEGQAGAGSHSMGSEGLLPHVPEEGPLEGVPPQTPKRRMPPVPEGGLDPLR